LLQTLLTEVERLDLSFGAMMAFWWSALAACLVSVDILKLSQPAVIILFAPMLMHLLQYILFLSLSYVNHVYKLAQQD
jgi:ribose/xylose/arabinose/galactoside ABC-type transport system permease subunit